MNKLKQGIRKFTDDLTFIISFFLLTATYFIGVFITFLAARISGKRFLDNKEKESYWRDLNLKEKPIEEYYKQF